MKGGSKLEGDGKGLGQQWRTGENLLPSAKQCWEQATKVLRNLFLFIILLQSHTIALKVI